MASHFISVRGLRGFTFFPLSFSRSNVCIRWLLTMLYVLGGWMDNVIGWSRCCFLCDQSLSTLFWASVLLFQTVNRLMALVSFQLGCLGVVIPLLWWSLYQLSWGSDWPHSRRGVRSLLMANLAARWVRLFLVCVFESLVACILFFPPVFFCKRGVGPPLCPIVRLRS